MELVVMFVLVPVLLLAVVWLLIRCVLVSPALVILACVVVLVVLLLSGCAGTTVGELGIGPQDALHHSSRLDWKGSGGRVDVRIRRISEGGGRYCEWTHASNLTSGWPFNDRYEDFEERVSCGVRVNLSALGSSR